MIRKTTQPERPDGTKPIVHVELERLVFTLPGYVGESYEIRLREILESGDVHAALLWANFFQFSEMLGLQRQIIDAAQQQRAEAKAQLETLDVGKLVEGFMATAAAGGGPASPGGDGSRTCSGGTVTPKES